MTPMTSRKAIIVALLLLVIGAQAGYGQSPEIQDNNPLPTIYIAGDSTASNGVPQAVGWGRFFGEYFEAPVVNRARGGRSSRTFITEGLWDQLLEEVQAGDVVLIQFGHNDGGAINHKIAPRGSLPGIGEETEEIDNLVTQKHEVVHTFGWYIRKMVNDVRAKEARPILLSLTVRNGWPNGRVERGAGYFGQWIRAIAEQDKVPFVDATKIIADHYEAIGKDEVAQYFPRDPVHTSAEGAALNARLITSGLKGLREQPLIDLLSAQGRSVVTADPNNVLVAPPQVDRNDPEARRLWLNLSVPGDPCLPNLILIGDSTVRNGRGDGSNGQFGWGDPLGKYFDPAKVNVVNRAVGGTGAWTYQRSDNYREVLAMLKPGDTVLIQFGHNDNGPYGALRGVGEETEERKVPRSEETDTVHSFGWYLRQYVGDIRQRGATPILCSLVPRKIWRDGKIIRVPTGHAHWARQVAESENIGFIDLYERIAQRYDGLGPEQVEPLFADQGVHTSWSGAVLNAECVLAGLEALSSNPVAAYLRKND